MPRMKDASVVDIAVLKPTENPSNVQDGITWYIMMDVPSNGVVSTLLGS